MTEKVETVITEEIAPTRFERVKKVLSKIDATYVVVGAAAAVAIAVTIIGINGAKTIEDEYDDGSDDPTDIEYTPEVVETTQD